MKQKPPRASIRLIPVVESDSTLEKAEQIRKTSNSSQYRMSVLSEDEFMGIKLEAKDFILRDLLTMESIIIINGFRGSGKSWFVLSMANEVTWGGRLGPWKVENPVNTLVIDGEMPMALIQERLKALNVNRSPISTKPSKLYFYPEAYAYRIGLKRSNLLDEKWRKSVSQMVKELDIRLLFLDNLSSLAPGIDENDKMPFDPVNRWLLELRFNGVSTVMTHHTGKSGEQRGTTAHEDHVDISILMKRPNGYKQSQGCRFISHPNKDRAHVTGGMVHTLTLVDNDGRKEFMVEEEKGVLRATRIIQDNPGINYKEAKEEFGISMKTFYRAKNQIGDEQV